VNGRDGRTSISKWQRHLPKDSSKRRRTLLDGVSNGGVDEEPNFLSKCYVIVALWYLDTFLSSEDPVYSRSRYGAAATEEMDINREQGTESTELEDHEDDVGGALKTSSAINMFSMPRRDSAIANRWLKSQMKTKGPIASIFPCSFTIELTSSVRMVSQALRPGGNQTRNRTMFIV
jgi:hypothetical protein